jgi:plastocyanin
MREPAADTGAMGTRAIAALVATLASLTLLSVPASGAAAMGIPRGPAPSGEEHVDAFDDYFLPSAVEIAPGERVVWDFSGSRTHTATDASGMALFDSGLVAPGGPTFAHAFDAAGTYRYVCTLHETMRGRVWVVVDVSRRRRPHGRPFALTWATGPAPAGSVYDVQLKRPGKPWRILASGLTAPGRAFTPTRAGVFRVRARLRSLTAGMAEWSPATRLEAT